MPFSHHHVSVYSFPGIFVFLLKYYLFMQEQSLLALFSFLNHPFCSYPSPVLWGRRFISSRRQVLSSRLLYLRKPLWPPLELAPFLSFFFVGVLVALLCPCTSSHHSSSGIQLNLSYSTRDPWVFKLPSLEPPLFYFPLLRLRLY